MAERSEFERRLRRVAVLAIGFAVAATALGFIPDTMATWNVPWGVKNPASYVPDHVDLSCAGGMTFLFWTVLEGWFARWVLHHPTRVRAWLWSVITVVAAPIAFIVWTFVEHEQPFFSHSEPRGLGYAALACAGISIALLVAVLPIVVLASRHTPPSDTPTARVV